MKKSLIFWLAVSVCTAWILVGCDNGTTTTETVTKTVGAAADLEGLQALLAEPGVNQVTYYGDLTITGGKLVSVPEGKTLTVTGGITLAGASDVLVVAGGLNFTGTITNSGVVIGVAADKVSGGTTGAIVSGLDDPKIGTVSAMKDYTLTSNASAIPSSLTLYVYGNLTVAADSVQPTQGKVVAIGTVTLAANNAVALSNATYVDVSLAEITVSGEGRDARTVTLPGTISTRFYLSGQQDKLTVTGGATSFTAYVRGNGLLELASVVTAVAITGSGNVEFDGALTALQGSIEAAKVKFTNTVTTASATLGFSNLSATSGTVEFANTAVFTSGATFSNTGLTTFANTVTSTATGTSFAGDVVFKGNVTVTAGGLGFGGAAYFADEAVVTLTDATSVITLKPTAMLAHGDATKIPAVYSAILANLDPGEGDVTLTPEANTTLTFGENGTKSITQGASGSNAHSITIGGNAALIASATYTVASTTSKVGTLKVADSGSLTIGQGALSGFPAGADNGTTSAKLVLAAGLPIPTAHC